MGGSKTIHVYWSRSVLPRVGWCPRVRSAKQTRQGKPNQEFFLDFQSFAHNRQTLRAKSFWTGGDDEQLRLFLAVLRPHKPECSLTLARWLRTLLGTSVLKAYSAQCEATSVVSNILCRCSRHSDWSSDCSYACEFSKSCTSIPYNTPACMHVLCKLQ